MQLLTFILSVGAFDIFDIYIVMCQLPQFYLFTFKSYGFPLFYYID